MNKNYLYLLSAMLTLAVLAACQKKSSVNNQILTPAPPPPPYDTVYPLSYFPVYPGSYWEYTIDTGGIITIKTDSTYKKDAYTVGVAAYQSDTAFVPFYDGVPIWGYEAHTGPISHAGSYPLTQILSDTLTVGDHWIIASWQGNQISRKITAMNSSVTVSGNTYSPTIVVEEYYSQGPPTYIWKAKRYYALNIGLVKEEINEPNTSTVYTKELTNYFINN